MSDWKNGVHPVHFKARVMLKPRQPEKLKPQPAKPVVKSNSRGLVSHIWDEWTCKNFDV